MRNLLFSLTFFCFAGFSASLDKPYYTCNEIPGNYGFCFTNAALRYAHISCKGDINGDGFDDIFNFSNSDSFDYIDGKFWLAWGSMSISAWVNIKDKTISVSGNNFAGRPTSYLKRMITLAHDINNDGKDDIIIGGSRYENYTGSFYIIWADSWEETNHINAVTWNSTNFLQIIGNGNSRCLGESLDFVDINGNGNLELVVSAPHANGMTGGVANLEWGGQVYFIKFNNNWRTNETLTFGQPPITNYSTYYGNREYCSSGKTISNVKDINCDGYDDLAFNGAPQTGLGGYTVNIIYGGQTLPDDFSQEFFDGTNGFMIIDQRANIIEPLGDVNGDNIDDMVISAPGACDYIFHNIWYSNVCAGSAYIFFGRTNKFPHYIDKDWCDGTNGAKVCAGMVNVEAFSSTLDSAGDMNGDGFRDLIVGNAQQDGFYFPPEYVYVIFGRPDWHEITPMTLDTLDGVFSFYVEGVHNVGPEGGNTYLFGRDVAGGGDVNGDGFDDVLMGEQKKERIYVMYGGESRPQPPSIRGPVHVFQGTTNTWQYVAETNTLIFGLKPTNAWQFAYTNNVHWPQGDHAPGSLHFTNSISWQPDEIITLTYVTSNSVGLGPYSTTLIIQPIPEPIFIQLFMLIATGIFRTTKGTKITKIII